MLKAYNVGHKTFQKYPYTYRGEPLFVSEYGGIKWDVNSGLTNAWGYGNAPTTLEEFHERYKGLTDVLLDTLGGAFGVLFGVALFALASTIKEKKNKKLKKDEKKP